MSPPRSSEEKEIMSGVGWWRGLVYPPLFLSVSTAIFVKFRPGMYDKFLRMRRTLATIGFSSFAAVGIMEFYVENRILAQKLPDGFYKWQYKHFSDTGGVKLRLNYAEADEYWVQHPIEQKWRFQFRAMGSLSDFTANPNKVETLSKAFDLQVDLPEKIDEKFWAEHLRFWNDRPQRRELMKSVNENNENN